MSPFDIAPDDIVRTHAEAEGNARPPLVVLEPLMAFLDAAGLGSGEMEIEPVGDGHSNVTYVVRREGAEVVLRRPPRPPLPPSAHDVLREARVIAALDGRGVRVAKVLAVGDDPAIIGSPFYVMERVEGEVVSDQMPAVLDEPAERRRMGEELIDALVEVHGADWRAAGLEGFGKPQGYLERQLRRFTGLWEHNKTRDINAVETVGEWLRTNLPESGEATVVHGDYRLGNTMFAAGGDGSPARLIAIFDWEMATIGDPLADLGYLCALWTQEGDPSGGLREHLGKVTRLEGFPTRAALVARYEEGSGRAMGDMRWYMTLAIWKSIVFMEGNYKRAVSGATDDPYLRAFGDGVVELAEQAEALALGNGQI
ncbi:MAG: phosphotransferase family protein [Solirubrobacteraceae bacterium]